jgi:hypothetical protein
MFGSVPLCSERKERSGTELKVWRLVPVLVRGYNHWFFDPVLIPAVFIFVFHLMDARSTRKLNPELAWELELDDTKL